MLVQTLFAVMPNDSQGRTDSSRTHGTVFNGIFDERTRSMTYAYATGAHAMHVMDASSLRLW